jgi:hypothetical protein
MGLGYSYGNSLIAFSPTKGLFALVNSEGDIGLYTGVR